MGKSRCSVYQSVQSNAFHSLIYPLNNTNTGISSDAWQIVLAMNAVKNVFIIIGIFIMNWLELELYCGFPGVDNSAMTQ